jgi:RNA polymerase sigma-B factor
MTSPITDRELLVRWRQDGDARARDQLIERYLGFSRALAHRFTRHGEPIDDLEQVAALALVKAIDRYDLEREVAITTYAMPTIVGELRRHYRDRVWAVHVPRGIQDLSTRIARATDEATRRLGRTPTVAELAQTLERSAEDIAEAIASIASRHAQSIWTSGDGEHDLVETVGEPDPAFVNADDRLTLEPALGALGDRDRVILRLRFVDGLSQSEIAARVGISQMHVSRLLRRALAELATTISGEEP